MERRFILPGLLAATLLAGALRLASLGSVPVALYCDESFSGYEAWCLLHTARDSRGVLLPFFFDIFGKGWGEPLYIYLTVPAVGLLGLTPFAARLVAALAGTLAVAATGLMTAALLKRDLGAVRAARAGVCAAALMAISPWAFHLSRIAFQASLLPLALAAGFWLAARALSHPEEPRPRMLAAGAALLGLSLYTYTIARLAMPLLVAGFAWLHRKRLRSPLPAAIVLAALIVPIAAFSLTERGRQRFSDVSILTMRTSRGAPDAGTLQKAGVAWSHYLSYYTPRFLLAEGDPNLRHSIRGHGTLHPHDVALLLVGAASCLLLRTPGSRFALWWLAVYPAAAALTVDPRHAVRAICGLPGIYMIEGMGAAAIWSALARRAGPGWRRVTATALATAMVAVSGLTVARYFHDYFVDYPAYSGPAWQYGLKEVYQITEPALGDRQAHDSVYVTRYEDHPYSQYLFYQAVPPGEYQTYHLSRRPYIFGHDRWEPGPGRERPIFVWKPEEVPDSDAVEVRHVIKYPDGSDAFVIAW